MRRDPLVPFVVMFKSARPPGRVYARDLDWARWKAWETFGSDEHYKVLTEDEYEIEKLIAGQPPEPDMDDCA